MMKTTFTDAVLAGRKYEITQARMGDSSFQRALDGKYLLFPPAFTYASNPSNYEFQNRLGFTENIPEAKAMELFAEGFLNTWPQGRNSCLSFVSTWKSEPINIPKTVSANAMQEYAIAKISIDNYIGADRRNDYKMFRYWYGLRRIDPDTQKITYYPSISEIFSYAIPNMNRVQYADGSKQGAINFLMKYDGNQATTPYDIVMSVEVAWDDGTTTIEPYNKIVHLNLQGETVSCRIQDSLSAYRNNGLHNIEEKNYNDIPEKMAVMMVVMAMMVRKYPRATPKTLLEKLVMACVETQQPANLTEKYLSFKELDTSVSPPVVKAYGWASQGNGLGFEVVLSMWNYVSNEGNAKVPTWGAFPAKFLEDIQFISYGEVYDTGLVVCPHCKACDYVQDANFIDFGVYFGNDRNPLTSVTCDPKMVNGVYVFQAVGLIKCEHCDEPYYRKFNSQMRTLPEQMPIGEQELKLRKSYNASWVIRSQGKGARRGQIRGYMFREHTKGELPSILFYLYYGGNVMSVEYPLEVGIQSRVALRDLVCTGESRLNGIPSHTYYDNNYAPPERDPYASGASTQLSMLGGGKYRGPQSMWSGVDPRTGTKSCKLCDKVGVATTLGEDVAYQRGARIFLEIDRGDGSKVFDRAEDMGNDMNNPYYNIRLTTPSKNIIRNLQVPCELVGVPIQGNPSPIEPKINGMVCGNDLWVQQYSRIVVEYGEALEQEMGTKAEFIVCEGLAWSGRYDENKREWVVSEPRNMASWLSAYDVIGGTVGEIDKNTWNDGVNKSCTLANGNQIDRFPARDCLSPISYVSPYASCQSTQNIPLSHDVRLQSTEIEEQGDVKLRRDFYSCVTCEASYKASANASEASQFIIPFATDPSNTPPITGGNEGLYDPANKWYFTRFLYAPHNETIQDLTTKTETKDDAKRRIPRNIFTWLENGKTFPQSSKNKPTKKEDE